MHNIKSPKYSMHFLLVSGLKGRDLGLFWLPVLQELGRGWCGWWLSWMAGQWLAGEADRLAVAAYPLTLVSGLAGLSLCTPASAQRAGWMSRFTVSLCFENNGDFLLNPSGDAVLRFSTWQSSRCFSHPYCWMWSEEDTGQDSLSCSVISFSKLTELKTAENVWAPGDL